MDTGEALRARTARLFVLSGAGISAGAGLGTYRGRGGRYGRGGMVPLQAHDATSRRVAGLWERLAPLAAAAAAGVAGPAHHALAAYERDGGQITIATQNVDGLHQRAGSVRVLELHGNLARARCLNPACRWPVAGGYPDPEQSDGVPRCRRCAARLRPDVVLFGEQLDKGVWDQALAAALAADVVLVVGTSVQVHPAAGLVSAALGHGAAGYWLELDPGRMLADVSAEVRQEVARLVAVPGECDLTLPELLSPRAR